MTRLDAATNYNDTRAAFDPNVVAPCISTPSGPEPADGDDELFLLGERIAELAARINSAESRMMTLIADFDRRGGWKDGCSLHAMI